MDQRTVTGGRGEPCTTRSATLVGAGSLAILGGSERSTASEVHQVDASPALLEVLCGLQAERRRAGPWCEPDGWVFTSRDGRHPMGETVFSRGWQRLRRQFAARGVRPLTLHSARHTWTTLALRVGKSIRWIAEQLGHSDPPVTLEHLRARAAGR